MRKVILILLTALIFTGCDFFTQRGENLVQKAELVEIDAPEQLPETERKWTIFIYMCADNNLESAAIDDICEMENSNLNTEEVTVVMLVDRTPLYNSTNGNWSGTKLYRLKTGRSENQTAVISEELECKVLGITADGDVELDMSDGSTLSSAARWVYDKFPAVNYGFIMWGHGSGWRGAESSIVEGEVTTAEGDSTFEEKACKGFAYDETSGTSLSLSRLKQSLNDGMEDKTLDFLGFDTCYGAELEILYELRDTAGYCCGSEGLISTSGWDYKSLFNSFQLSQNKSVEDLLEAVYLQFSALYANTSRASFCICDLSKIDAYFKAFDSFMELCGKAITSVELRDKVLQTVYASDDCKTERYTYGKEGYDIYLDCYSLCQNLWELWSGGAEGSVASSEGGATEAGGTEVAMGAAVEGGATVEGGAGATVEAEVSEALLQFVAADKECIIKSWASDRDRGGPGVFFQTLGSGGLLQTSYNSNYVKGKCYGQIDFVQNSVGYVPNVNLSESFLDRLFFSTF